MAALVALAVLLGAATTVCQSIDSECGELLIRGVTLIDTPLPSRTVRTRPDQDLRVRLPPLSTHCEEDQGHVPPCVLPPGTLLMPCYYFRPRGGRY